MNEESKKILAKKLLKYAKDLLAEDIVIGGKTIDPDQDAVTSLRSELSGKNEGGLNVKVTKYMKYPELMKFLKTRGNVSSIRIIDLVSLLKKIIEIKTKMEPKEVQEKSE